MGAKKSVRREDILVAAEKILTERGEGAVCARSIAREIGCSTQPIYDAFSGMEEVRRGLIARAADTYARVTEEIAAEGKYPAYKCMGMAYVRFGRLYPNMFRMLFMDNGEAVGATVGEDMVTEAAKRISASTGMSLERARKFHYTMWISIHGMGVFAATGYLKLTEDEISEILTEIYRGLLHVNGIDA